jgi:hypothetical protein
MGIRKFTDELAQRAGKCLDVQEFTLYYKNGAYPFLRLVSSGIAPDDKIFLLTTGFHGDEPAGPRTMQDSIDIIADHVHDAGLKLICYPLINPSGFSLGQRYNVDGQEYNNDFLRYEINNGKIAELVSAHKPYKRWLWASQAGVNAPLETRTLESCLRGDLKRNVVAAIDLHQDAHITAPGVYCFAFGDSRRYNTIMKTVSAAAPIFRSKKIDSQCGDSDYCDRYGFVHRNDGSITDLCHKMGVEHCIAVETTKGLSPIVAISVNMIWIKGLLEMVKRKE